MWLAQYECKRESNWVKHRQKLNAKVLLACVHNFKRIHSVWLLPIYDKNVRLTPNTRNKLFVVKLFNEACVLTFKVTFTQHHECISLRLLQLWRLSNTELYQLPWLGLKIIGKFFRGSSDYCRFSFLLDWFSNYLVTWFLQDRSWRNTRPSKVRLCLAEQFLSFDPLWHLLFNFAIHTIVYWVSLHIKFLARGPWLFLNFLNVLLSLQFLSAWWIWLFSFLLEWWSRFFRITALKRLVNLCTWAFLIIFANRLLALAIRRGLQIFLTISLYCLLPWCCLSGSSFVYVNVWLLLLFFKWQFRVVHHTKHGLWMVLSQRWQLSLLSIWVLRCSIVR